MAYSIIAPGVSVENFGAGQGQSRLQRFTSGLYKNLEKSDGLDKLLMDGRARRAVQPYQDQAKIAKARQDTKESENKTIMAMIAQRTAVCTAAPGSEACLAWDAKVRAAVGAAAQKQDNLTPEKLSAMGANAIGSYGTAPLASTAASLVLPADSRDPTAGEYQQQAAYDADLAEQEAQRQAEEDAMYAYGQGT
jgi:hypothetical protein